VDFSALDRTVTRIEADPRSGQSLLLYALLKTLDIPQGGHAYLLSKLKEMNPDSRELAYGLMELMASGGRADPRWPDLVARIDRAIGGARG
jgi:hypothetical protein